MVLSISLVLLFGILTVALIKFGYQRVMPAVVVGLFGFFLASTGIAPTITNAVSSVAGWISSL